MASENHLTLPVSEELVPRDASSTDLPRTVRQGWDDAFRRMAEFKDDRLIDDVDSLTFFVQTEWEW